MHTLQPLGFPRFVCSSTEIKAGLANGTKEHHGEVMDLYQDHHLGRYNSVSGGGRVILE